MRKELLLPGIAVAGGIAGHVLRRWNLATAFESETHLARSGAPSTTALVILTAVVLLLLAVLCPHKSYSGNYNQAFSAKSRQSILAAVVCAAFLLAGAALFQLVGLPLAYLEVAAELEGQYNAGNPLLGLLPQVLLTVLCSVSAVCILATGKNNYRDEKRGQYSLMLLMPAYTFGIWLVCAYQDRAGDPVLLDYIFEFLAIITCLLGLYSIAGFAFQRVRVFQTVFFSLAAVYFSAVTLADQLSPEALLLYGFAALYLLAQTAVLLTNLQQPVPEAAPDTLEIETEGTPDAQS
ncbi:MAG: hypothetical protein HFE97_02500 [Oscillospiraceae bacterium]|nr:hypothetical protein [Oscillospiraceae bacterium]